MGVYIGIDLGTTGLKSLLVKEDGTILGSGYAEYPISIPVTGYAEQNPMDWWNALKTTLGEAMKQSGVSANEIKGIGLSGQMHGTVLLDKQGNLLHHAIVWCDQRSVAEVAEIRELVGEENLGKWTQNPVATGFQVCSLLWVRKNLPEIYEKIAYVLLPKDFIRYKLTGLIGSDRTDACSTLMFDCANQDWSDNMLSALDIDRAILPKGDNSPYDRAGELCEDAARELGLNKNTAVAFGGGDQPMQAIGNGILNPGDASVTLGTGGQIFVPVAEPLYDKKLRLHSFCHAPKDSWYIMGAILNCCLAQNWFFDKVLGTHDFAAMHSLAKDVPVGSDGLYFLPYLTGERTPHLNANARGMFFGLTLAHDRASMVRAVIEGISYALLDAMLCIEDLGVKVDRLILSGGGARSLLWKQIIADMLGKPIYTTSMKEEAGTGAAICAMVAAGEYPSLEAACKKIVKYDDGCVMPDPENTAFYRTHFETYKSLYKANCELFGK